MGTEKNETEVLNATCNLREENGQESSKPRASRTVEVDNFRQRLGQGQRGGGPSIGFHLTRPSTFGVRERCFVFPFSAKAQRAVRPSSVVTYLNDLFDDFAYFSGELSEGDSLRGFAPVISPQLMILELSLIQMAHY